MKIIGKIPESETYLLTDADVEPDKRPPIDTEAQVLRLTDDGGTLHDKEKFHTITANMPRFEMYEANEGELEDLLSAVDSNKDGDSSSVVE